MDPSDFGEGLTKLGDTYAPPPEEDSPIMCPACPLFLRSTDNGVFHFFKYGQG